METELQKELMFYVSELKGYNVPELLISRFERTAIKRYEEIKWSKLGKAIEENKIQKQVKESLQLKEGRSKE